MDTKVEATLLQCFHCGKKITEVDTVKTIRVGSSTYHVHEYRCFVHDAIEVVVKNEGKQFINPDFER
jgi:hypothetical protein